MLTGEVEYGIASKALGGQLSGTKMKEAAEEKKEGKKRVKGQKSKKKHFKHKRDKSKTEKRNATKAGDISFIKDDDAQMSGAHETSVLKEEEMREKECSGIDLTRKKKEI